MARKCRIYGALCAFLIVENMGQIRHVYRKTGNAENLKLNVGDSM